MTVPRLTIGETVTITVRAKVFAQPRPDDARYAFTYEHEAGCGENFLHVDIASPVVRVRRDEPGEDISLETLMDSVRHICNGGNYDDDSQRVRLIRRALDTFGSAA